MNIPRETPSGLLLHSREFVIAAGLVLNKASGVSLPAYFLLGRSIELSLKAYLLACEMTIKELASRTFGHNLASLFAEACRRGLLDKVKIEPLEAGVLELLSYDYVEKRLEYRVTDGTYHLPHIDVTERIAQKLVSGLTGFCNEVPDHRNT